MTADDSTKKVDIAMIGAAAFHRHMKNPETEIYWASLQCIEEAIYEKRNPPSTTEVPEYKPDKEEIIKRHLPKEYHDLIHVFSKKELDCLPELTPQCTHHINIPKDVDPAKIIRYSLLYKQSVQELEAAQDYIRQNLKKQFIVPSTAPYASPVLMAKKPGGGLQFCIDF